MGLLFNNWLEEGYYEWNDFDGYSKVDGNALIEAKDNGTLYHSDGSGYGLSKVNDENLEKDEIERL